MVNITPTNAEVQLISEQTIFVAIDGLRKCYPERPNDCWLGKKKKKKARQPSSCCGSTSGTSKERPQHPIDEEASHLETGRRGHPLVSHFSVCASSGRDAFEGREL